MLGTHNTTQTYSQESPAHPSFMKEERVGIVRYPVGYIHSDRITEGGGVTDTDEPEAGEEGVPDTADTHRQPRAPTLLLP